MIIEVPHFASLRGKEREIVILRSDNGEIWREHTMEANEEAIHEALNGSFEGEGDYSVGMAPGMQQPLSSSSSSDHRLRQPPSPQPAQPACFAGCIQVAYR